MGLIVDTDVFIEAERAIPPTLPAFLAEDLLRKVEDEELAICAITLTEIAFGHAFGSRLPAQVRDRIMHEIRAEFRIISIEERIALRSGILNATLKRAGTTIGISDVLIAATALELGFGVLTHNTRHFNYVPDLRVIDASTL